MKGFRVLGEPLFAQGLTARLRLGTRMTAGGAGDTTAPTCVITCAQSSPTATTPLNFTFTLSEDSTDFDINSITAGGVGGTKSNFAGSGSSYTCDIAPTSGGVMTVDVAAGAFHDAAGNGNTAATQFSITYAPTYAVVFDGTNTYLMIGSEATLDDIHDNAFTAEGWFKITASAAGLNRPLIEKVGASAGSLGWGLYYNTSKFGAIVTCITTSAWREFSATPHNSVWRHIAMTWDDAGDRNVRIFIDGQEPGAYNIQDVQGNGAIKSDAAFNGSIGSAYDTNNRMTGRIGWVRISNNIRYTVPFTPPPHATLPLPMTPTPSDFSRWTKGRERT